MTSNDQCVLNNKLLSAVREGDTETVRSLINSNGLAPFRSSTAWRGGYDLLCDATERNHTATAELLLTCGSDVNCPNYEYTDSPLHFAALHGNVDIVKLLLKHGAAVNYVQVSSKSPLFIVIENIDDGCKQDRVEIVELLLKHKADVNGFDKNHNSPLHVAVNKRCIEIVQLLLEYSAYVNCVNGTNWLTGYTIGSTPLHYAVENNLKEIVTLLLSKGARINIFDKDGQTPLHIAYRKGYSHEEIVKLLLDAYKDDYKDNLSPLVVAIKKEDAKIVKLLLEHGAEVDDQDSDGKTALHLAVENKCLEIVQDILKCHPDVSNEINRRSLITAVWDYGTEKIIEALLEYGFKIEPKDTHDPKLLQAAVKNGYSKIVEALLKNGADVNMYYSPSYKEAGFTLLHCAAKNMHDKIVIFLRDNEFKDEDEFERIRISSVTPIFMHYKEIAKLLINYKADVNIKDDFGKTPIFYAIDNADLNITKLLLDNGADVNVKDDFGKTPIFYAIDNADLNITKLLLDNGADVNAQDKTGKALIYYAVEYNDLKITKLLLANKADANPKLLHFAVRKECLDVIEVLLQHGIDINASDECGRTALQLIVSEEDIEIRRSINRFNLRQLRNQCFNNKKRIKKKYNEKKNIVKGKIVELLLSKDANINSNSGLTIFWIAICKGFAEVVEALLEHNINYLYSRDTCGRTALHIACKHACKEVVETLLKYGCDINDVCYDKHAALNYAAKDYYRYFSDDFYESVQDLSYETDILRRGGTVSVLVAQIVKMKTANLYVSEKNLLLYTKIKTADYTDHWNGFENECEKEIALMKSKKIKNDKVSFCDILTTDINLLLKYMKNQNIVQVLESNEYYSEFPIYGSMIKSIFRKTMKRKELLEQLNEIIYFLFKSLSGIPYVCTEKIFSYVSDEDLLNIREACMLSDYQYNYEYVY